jgi:hypothetical protein
MLRSVYITAANGAKTRVHCSGIADGDASTEAREEGGEFGKQAADMRDAAAEKCSESIGGRVA